MTATRVVVIGGGIAGVSIAAELASGGVGVVLVEQEAQLAHHTTGRSAAMYLQSYGPEPVRNLTVASLPVFDDLATEQGTPLLDPRLLLYVADDGGVDSLRAEIEHTSMLRPVAPSEALDLCSALRLDAIAAAAVDDSGADIDVASLHAAYVTRLRRAGGVILRSAPVRSIERSATGWKVTAGDELLASDAVVNAAGAWADIVAEMAGVRPLGLRPLRRTIFVSPVGAFGDLERWPLVADAREQWYFRPEAGGVLGSPADETLSPPCDARPEEVDIAIGIERINQRTTLALRTVRTSWAGLRTFAADRRPVIGPDPDAGTFIWFAGQGGYGIQMAPAAAQLGAALALEQSPPPAVRSAVAAVSPSRFDPAGE